MVCIPVTNIFGDSGKTGPKNDQAHCISFLSDKSKEIRFLLQKKALFTK